MARHDAHVIPLFYPEIDETAWSEVAAVLASKWVGQGPRVEEFEAAFAAKYHPNWHPVAVSSGTAALTLAYILAGVTHGSRVVGPIFTCTATNLPVLHLGGTVAFADVEPDTLNIDPQSVYRLLEKPTKAIVAVDYAGAVANVRELKEMARGIPIIQDAAQSLGNPAVGLYSDYICYSFQAIKHLTTGDGGMLLCKTALEANVAKRIRWFGIDRRAKLEDRWSNDIVELGYKFQMTDISAAIGLANLRNIDERLEYRRMLFRLYGKHLAGTEANLIGAEQLLDGAHAAWVCTITGKNMNRLKDKLAKHGIESNQTHYRNDRYSVFLKSCEFTDYPGMNSMDDGYLLLPLHGKVTEDDVVRICEIIEGGW